MTHIDFDDASATTTKKPITVTRWAAQHGFQNAVKLLPEVDRRLLASDLRFVEQYEERVNESVFRIGEVIERLRKVHAAGLAANLKMETTE